MRKANYIFEQTIPTPPDFLAARLYNVHILRLTHFFYINFSIELYFSEISAYTCIYKFPIAVCFEAHLAILI